MGRYCDQVADIQALLVVNIPRLTSMPPEDDVSCALLHGPISPSRYQAANSERPDCLLPAEPSNDVQGNHWGGLSRAPPGHSAAPHGAGRKASAPCLQRSQPDAPLPPADNPDPEENPPTTFFQPTPFPNLTFFKKFSSGTRSAPSVSTLNTILLESSSSAYIFLFPSVPLG